MIKPVPHTKHPTLCRVVLRAVVGNKLFRNFLLVDYTFKMIGDSPRADISQVSCDWKFAVEVGN